MSWARQLDLEQQRDPPQAAVSRHSCRKLANRVQMVRLSSTYSVNVSAFPSVEPLFSVNWDSQMTDVFGDTAANRNVFPSISVGFLLYLFVVLTRSFRTIYIRVLMFIKRRARSQP